MLRIDPDVPPHVVSFTIDGTVTARDMDGLYRAVEGAMGGKRPAHVLAEIRGVGGLTLEAVSTNVKRGLGLLPKLGRIRRYAVVTDLGWLAGLAKAQGAAIPGLEVRTYAPEDRADALAWVSETADA